MYDEAGAEGAIAAPPEITHLDADLEEDIGAEIEDLTLARRLGQHEDALDIIRTVLLRHVQHFPVFAEVSAYLWSKNDLKMLDEACSSLRRSDLSWDTMEVAYFDYMAGEKNRSPILTDDTYLRQGVPRDPTGLQFLEAYLHTAPAETFCPSTNLSTVEQLVTLFNDFVTENLWWDAANIFSKFCEYYPVISTKNADKKLILNLYNKAGYSQPVKTILVQLEEDFEAYLPIALATLSAKTALMLYIVRIYDTAVEVMAKFVLAGMPFLRTLSKEVQDISYVLNARLGFDYAKSDYYTFGESCMEYWRYSEGCATTVRLLNERLRKFSVLELPEIAAVPFENWLRQPPVAAIGKYAVKNPERRSLETYINFPVHGDSLPHGRAIAPILLPEFLQRSASRTGCQACRKRMVQCNMDLPKCRRCSAGGHVCIYDDDSVHAKEWMAEARNSVSVYSDDQSDHGMYYM